MLSSHALIFGGLMGYVIGSIPFAYIMTKWKAGLDLRNEGSQNIGARNAFEVTGDKSIGIIVLVADLLKGLLPVLLFEQAGFSDALLVLIPALILGHCYPIWLRFHGGRGLATAAGALILVCPLAIVFWLIIYFISNSITKQVHFSTVMACGAALLVILLFTGVLEAITLHRSGLNDKISELQISLGLLILIILSRHIEPIVAMMRKNAA